VCLVRFVAKPVNNRLGSSHKNPSPVFDVTVP
jgi:hypothetical protein